MKANVTGQTMYDINKQLVKQVEKDFTEEQLKNTRKSLEEWFAAKEENNYFMLLCKDAEPAPYFTLFDFARNSLNPRSEQAQKAAEAVIDCLKVCGESVRGADLQNDGAWEFWVMSEKEPFAYYLFPYDAGVIEC